MEAYNISEAVEDLNHSIDNIKYFNNNKQRCSECDSDWIVHDYKRAETICHNCGLVLSGPPGYIAGQIKISYPVAYNFFSEAVGKGHNTKQGYFQAYYYFPEYTNNLH